MGRLRRLFLRLLFRKEISRIESEIDEEFRFHVDMKAASFVAQGLEPDEARARALGCFGDLDGLKRAGLDGLAAARRKERSVRSLGWLGQDLADGARQLLRHPGFSFLAMGTLAMGLATSTAVLTYVNAYRESFPGADSRRVYQLFLGSSDTPFNPLSYPDYQDLVEAGEGLFSVAALGRPLFAASVRTETYTEVVFGNAVTGSFFPLLRIDMSLGRGLSPGDDESDAPPVTVISHQYWMRRYGGDPEVLGQTLLLNGRPHSIVGVTGPRFLGSLSASRPQVWLPFSQFKPVYWARSDTEVNRDVGSVSPYLKLPDGVTVNQAKEALDALALRLDQEAPLADRARRFHLEPATWIHPSVRRAELPATRIMLIAAVSLLLLACANVANLVLSAGARRDQEMGIRCAMGASRGRLIRQLLSENFLLSILAGGLALLFAGPAARRLCSYFARPSVWGANVPREVSLDLRVLALGFLLALVAGLLTGILPALKAATRDPAPALKAGGRWSSEGVGGWGGGGAGPRGVLVSAQVALSVVLLFVAALVLRTLDSARDVEIGFDTQSTLASYVSTSSMAVPVAERHQFFRELIQRFEELPWVRAATVSEQAPLSSHPGRELRLQGSETLVQATIARVFPGYFEAMDVELLEGRTLLPSDTIPDLGVVVVNQALARRMRNEGSSLGWQLTVPGDVNGEERSYEVVGVVRNARITSLLANPEPVAYFSLPQHYSAPGNAFLLKVTGDPAGAVWRMEEELRAVDPRLAIVNVLPYSDIVDGFLYSQRMNAELFSIIAVLGLILATAGIFGVTSLAVARMRREIGIRLAMGAHPGSIAKLVVARVSTAVGVGLALGLAGTVLAAGWVRELIWGVQPMDPLSVVFGVGALLGAVVLAVSLPVQRAVRVDPTESLQAE